MPQDIGPVKRAVKRKRPKPKYSPPPSRSDAAQRPGARSPKPAVRPQTKTPAAPKAPTYSPPASSRTDAAQGNSRKKATRYKKTSPAYRKAVEDAYDANDAAGKKRLLDNATGVEGRIIRRLHKARDRNAAQSGRGDRNTQLSEDRGFGRSDIRSDADYHRGDEIKAGDEYLRTRRMARKVRYDRASDAEKDRLFGNPREDVKRPGVLSRFKAEDDRVTEMNRTRLREGVEAELTGQGKIAKGLSSLASSVTKPRGKEGGKGAGGQSFATIALGRLIPGYGAAPKKVKEIGERTVQDAVNFPAQAIPSVYVPTAAAIEAAGGDTERLKGYLRDIDENDPLWNVAAAAYEAATGDTKAASRRISAAGKAASEHPGFTALEVVGAKGTVGRGVGNVMRSGATGKRAKRAASTDRQVQALDGTRIVRKRSYSPDVITKAAQVKLEKRARKRAVKLRDRAKRAETADEKARLQRAASRVDPDVIQPHEIRTRVDERVDATEQVRRAHRAQATKAAREIKRKAGDQGTLVNLVAQGIVHADRADIREFVRDLEQIHPTLDKAGKRANKELRRSVEKALDNFDAGKVNRLADEYGEQVRPLEADLVRHGLLDPDQAELSRLMPYAVRRMGAKHDGDRLVTPDGEALGAAAIREHMEASGHDREPVFLSQAPNARGARNFYVASDKAPSVGNARRTGEATRQGTFDADPETLVEGPARSRGLVDAHEGFGGFLDEFGLRKTSGPGKGKVRQFGSRSQAQQAARNAVLDADGDPLPNATEWVPVRINPFGGSKQQLAHLLEDVNTPAKAQEAHSTLSEGISDALQGKGEDAGQWVLVPRAAAKRMQQHTARSAPTELGAAAQTLSGAFRRTVLATSLPWFIGNVAEATLRTTLAKAGPGSYVKGRRVVKRLREAGDDEAIARMIPGGHFSSAEKQKLHRGVGHFEDSALEPIARKLSAFWRAPGPKTAAAVWGHWTDLVFNQLNGRIETAAQTALLGRELRKSPIVDDHLRALSKRAVDQAAAGKVDTNTAVELGRAVDRAFGRYGKHSPAMRRSIALYTPFIAWSVNSVRFVLSVLPRDHPTVTALIAQSEIVADEWLEEHGLGQFIEGRLPGFLQGSIPGPGGSHFRASRFTPFGFWTDPLESAAGTVLPQASGIIAAAKGQDWTGRELRGSDGGEATDADKVKAMADQFIGGFIPFVSLGRQIAKKGPAGYAADAVTGRVAPRKSARKRKPGAGGVTWGDEASSGVKWSDQESGGSVTWSDGG